MKRRIISLLSFLILCSILLVGCGANPQKQASTTEQKPLKKLVVGYSPTGAVLGEIAHVKGYFKEEGLDIEFVQFSSTADALAALSSAKIDLGISFGTAAPLTLMNNGADFLIIGGHLSGGHPVLAMPETAAKIKSLQDYKGKTIATPRLYTPDVVWRGAMYDAGIDITKDLNLIEMKNPIAVMEAVKSGKADIGIASTMVYTKAKKAGISIIGWSNDFFSDHPCCRVVGRREPIEKDPDAYRAFMRALIRAEKFRVDQPEETVTIAQQFLKVDYEAAKDFVLEPHQILNADPNRKGVIKMWEEMKHIGYVEEKVDVIKRVNTDIYRQALTDLQKRYPSEQFYTKVLEERYKAQN